MCEVLFRLHTCYCTETVQKVIPQIKLENKFDHLFNAVNGWMGGCGHPVPQQSSIPPLEEHSQSSPEMGSSLSIWLTGVPGQCRGNLLHFPLCYLVPTPKGLCGEGEEGNPLLPAELIMAAV